MRAEGRGSSAEAFLRGRLAEAHVFSHAKNAIENGCFFLYVGPGREVRQRPMKRRAYAHLGLTEGFGH